MIRFLRKLFARKPSGDPRLAADPWLGGTFKRLGERYQLGPDGSRVLRRTGRARFNPMPVWLVSPDHVVRAEYEVRGAIEEARKLLDDRVAARMQALGLSGAGDKVEDWGGSVLTRTYQGRCDSAESAAAAVRFACEESETQVNLAAE